MSSSQDKKKVHWRREVGHRTLLHVTKNCAKLDDENISKGREQCDQIFAQHLAIYNNEVLSNGIKHLPKWVQNFANY